MARRRLLVEAPARGAFARDRPRPITSPTCFSAALVLSAFAGVARFFAPVTAALVFATAALPVIFFATCRPPRQKSAPGQSWPDVTTARTMPCDLPAVPRTARLEDALRHDAADCLRECGPVRGPTREAETCGDHHESVSVLTLLKGVAGAALACRSMCAGIERTGRTMVRVTLPGASRCTSAAAARGSCGCPPWGRTGAAARPGAAPRTC